MEDFSSNESVNSILDAKETELKKPEDLECKRERENHRKSGCCCCRRMGSICWSMVLIVACLVIGFVGGMVFGDQKNRTEQEVSLNEAQKATPCVTQLINPNYTTVCSVCAKAR